MDEKSAWYRVMARLAYAAPPQVPAVLDVKVSPPPYQVPSVRIAPPRCEAVLPVKSSQQLWKQLSSHWMNRRNALVLQMRQCHSARRWRNM